MLLLCAFIWTQSNVLRSGLSAEARNQGTLDFGGAAPFSEVSSLCFLFEVNRGSLRAEYHRCRLPGWAGGVHLFWFLRLHKSLGFCKGRKGCLFPPLLESHDCSTWRWKLQVDNRVAPAALRSGDVVKKASEHHRIPSWRELPCVRH